MKRCVGCKQELLPKDVIQLPLTGTICCSICYPVVSGKYFALVPPKRKYTRRKAQVEPGTTEVSGN